MVASLEWRAGHPKTSTGLMAARKEPLQTGTKPYAASWQTNTAIKKEELTRVAVDWVERASQQKSIAANMALSQAPVKLKRAWIGTAALPRTNITSAINAQAGLRKLGNTKDRVALANHGDGLSNGAGSLKTTTGLAINS